MNKPGQITLREAGTDDAAVVLRLMRAAFGEHEGVLDPPSGAHGETIDTVQRKLAHGAAVMATVADEPVGFAFYEAADELLYFGRLSVLPQWRNNGIGTAILDYVEQRARQIGAAGVRLGVRLSRRRRAAETRRKQISQYRNACKQILLTLGSEKIPLSATLRLCVRNFRLELPCARRR